MDNNIRTMEFIQLDYWGNPVYKCIETEQLWVDLNPPHSEQPALHRCIEIDDDPGYPINPNLEIRFINKYKQNPYKSTYELLGRLQSDCDYYLGYGSRCAKNLWAGDEQRQINKMKELYDSLPDNAKPEWLTWVQILKYEKEMIGGSNNV